MHSINSALLEEYKRLDKLCRDIYRSDKGITSYIDEMKSVSAFESRYIPNWNSDLRYLINLRHIRNQLSHDVGTLDISMCTQNDVDWLKNFYCRFLDTSDPLSLLAKHRRITKQPTFTPQQSVSIHKRKHSGCLGGILLTLSLVFLVAIIVCIF